MNLKRKKKLGMICVNKVHEKNKRKVNEMPIKERKNSKLNCNNIKSRAPFIKRCTKFYIGIESIIYVCYLFLELFADGYDKAILNLKYLSIFLCVLYCIVIIFFFSMKESSGTIYEREIKIRNYNSLLYLLSALILTFMADYYLLLKHENLFGVLYFVGVQISYMLYFHSNHSTLYLHLQLEETLKSRIDYNRNLFGLVLLGCIMFAGGLLTLQIIGADITFFEIILMLYLCLFVINISFCVFEWKKSKSLLVVYEKDYMLSIYRKYTCMLVGLLLYFICDLLVGIYNVDLYISEDVLPSVLTSIAEVGMWVFYLPGKVIISLSAYFISQETPCCVKCETVS